MAALGDNRYGKTRVRLVRVKRHSEQHDFCEWTVQILLRGDFASCFEEGDNSKILATDTMKNTVYSLARDSSAACMGGIWQGVDRFPAGPQPASFTDGSHHMGEGLGAHRCGRKAAPHCFCANER